MRVVFSLPDHNRRVSDRFPEAPMRKTIDWKKVDEALGKYRRGIRRGPSLRAYRGRTSNVTLDGVTIKPTLALGGWVAFQPMHGAAMVMGDLVLLETEINPVMAKLLDSGLDITAVHNHLLRATPRHLLHACRRAWRPREDGGSHS